MVFSARLVDWKLGSEPMASYYQMNDLPKKLQSKIKIDFNMENTILFSSKTEFWPKNKQLDLSKSKFRDQYQSIIFYRNSSINLKIPFRYLSSATSPILIGEFRLMISIGDKHTDGTTGSRDMGAVKLVEKLFTDYKELNQINSIFMKIFVKEILDNELKTIFKGLNNDNFRKIRNQIEVQSKDHMGELLAAYGFHLKNIEVKYKMTDKEKIESRKSSLETDLDKLEIDTRQNAMDAVKADSKLQGVLTEKEQIRIAKELVKRGKHRTQIADKERQIELDTVELEAEIDLEIMAVESEVKKIEISEIGKKISHDGKIDRIKDKQSIKEREIELEEKRKREDLQRKVDAALKMQTGGISVDLQRDILEVGGNKYGFTDIINPDLEKRIIAGEIHASQADDYIEGLDIKLKDASNSTEMQSDIYAALAIFHRLRGNKNDAMNEAIKKSLLLNKNNAMALKCRLDYMQKKRPQMFHPLKLEKFRNELIDFEKIADKILNVDYFDDEVKSEIKKMHIKTIEVLSNDKELGEIYRNKLNDEYYLDI
ncbi:MAG: hypothetical protein HOD35_04205 [Euryarchaeota archaeon]|jgi:hypothetical protein|nr:hypothetical protein [Euryarchaeota archaeon]MBT4802996.1 hypothetical protein [Euryarchaeota archaeon]MBT6683460.1 hypothetical protein [Euryarchaeota archaeon]MBT7413542.1 hypothetical protein [Euryarchaeota archaeon]